jgi:hypothetical protein
METLTRTDAGRSSLGTLVLLALSFVAGYVLGSRGGGESDEWQNVPDEPTEITIDGDGGEDDESEE